MKATRKIPKGQTFKVVVEPDDDRWHAYCPALDKYGAATWGNTKRKALKHIQEVVQMVVDELTEEGTPLPKRRQDVVEVFPVSVTLSHAD